MSDRMTHSFSVKVPCMDRFLALRRIVLELASPRPPHWVHKLLATANLPQLEEIQMIFVYPTLFLNTEDEGSRRYVTACGPLDRFFATRKKTLEEAFPIVSITSPLARRFGCSYDMFCRHVRKILPQAEANGCLTIQYPNV